jgi:hypothetical protein
VFEGWAQLAFSEPDMEEVGDGFPSFERKENGHYKFVGIDAAWIAWLAAREHYHG